MIYLKKRYLSVTVGKIINNKIIFLGVILAIILHGLLIPISSLIKINKVEEVEPKIILELIKKQKK